MFERGISDGSNCDFSERNVSQDFELIPPAAFGGQGINPQDVGS